MKFGGSSISNGEKIKNVSNIIKKYYENGKNEVVVVVSAFSGVTDSLISVAKDLSNDFFDETGIKNNISYKKEKIEDFIQKTRKIHISAIKDAIFDEDIQKSVIDKEEDILRELKNVLLGISYIGELTLRSLDYIMSFGERMSAPIVSASLRSLGINSMSYTGGEVGLITNDKFGDAKPLSSSYKLIRSNVETFLKEGVIVITGFIAKNKKGIITTLGRDGSDYTASIIGAAIDSDEIWIFTDVDGIMTADPDLIPDAQTIPLLSYLEAMELSYFGSSVIHPRTLEPAMNKNICVRIKNTFNPFKPGTAIVKEYEKSDKIVKAISCIKDVALVSVIGTGMIGMPGVAAKVFSALAKKDINVIMISQGSSEANISFVIKENHVEEAYNCLKEEFKDNLIKDIEYKRDVGIIAVVGAGMIGTPGVAAKVFSALAKKDINVIMISQGSSEANISFVIKENHVYDGVRALHKEFKLEIAEKTDFTS
ncbi:aspartate kinase [Candidatus Methanoliparum sp. LAM-1]|nr:aspartate kinase [Candidatus Methanoliparum sp. LAM-1]BDC35517.1 aspartate kinase [Candidatus Methanoliparum sp. LAM-1]